MCTRNLARNCHQRALYQLNKCFFAYFISGTALTCPLWTEAIYDLRESRNCPRTIDTYQDFWLLPSSKRKVDLYGDQTLKIGGSISKIHREILCPRHGNSKLWVAKQSIILPQFSTRQAIFVVRYKIECWEATVLITWTQHCMLDSLFRNTDS